MKIIFLDIDGVLARFAEDVDFSSYMYQDFRMWDKHCLQNLIDLIKATGAKVVISSTWRKFRKDIEWWNRQFQVATGVSTIQVVGLTCITNRGFRGDEVQQYCDEHNISDFVIFDDDGDFHALQKLKFVRTDPGKGLTVDDVELALTIFNAGMV